MVKRPSGVLTKTIVLPGILSDYGRLQPQECSSPAFIQKQWALVGKINKNDWLGYYAESLLFEGLNANLRDDGNCYVDGGVSQPSPGTSFSNILLQYASNNSSKKIHIFYSKKLYSNIINFILGSRF